MSDNPFEKGKSETKRARSTGNGGGGGRSPSVVIHNPDPSVIDYIAAGISFAPGENDDSDRWFVPLRSDNGWDIPDDMREDFGIPDDVENVSFDEFFDVTYNRREDVIKYLRTPVVRIDKLPGISVESEGSGSDWTPTEVLTEPENYPSDKLYNNDGEPNKYVPHPDFANNVESDEVIVSSTTTEANKFVLAHHYGQCVEAVGGTIQVGTPAKSDKTDDDGNSAWENERDRLSHVRFKTMDRDDEEYVETAQEMGIPAEDIQATLESIDSDVSFQPEE